MSFYQLFFGSHYNSFVQFLFDAKTMPAETFYNKYWHCFENNCPPQDIVEEPPLIFSLLRIKDDYYLFVCFAKAIGFLSEVPVYKSSSCVYDNYMRLISTKLSLSEKNTFDALHLEAIDIDNFTLDRQILAKLGYKTLFLSQQGDTTYHQDPTLYVFITKTENVSLFKQFDLAAYCINEHSLFGRHLRLYHRHPRTNTQGALG